MQKNTLDRAETIKSYDQKISDILDYRIFPKENTVNEMAYYCLSKDRISTAHELFLLNTLYYPESINAFDSLGDYYLEVKDKNNAILAFSKALSLCETRDIRNKLNDLKK